jgi:murein DD-endopeptidase MepM/ murein hydrolase activator NlpD
MKTPGTRTTGDASARSDNVRKGWPCVVACVAVFVAIVLATSSSPASSRTSEPSYGLPPDDRASPSNPTSNDPLECTDPRQVPLLENVLVSKWSPDSNMLAVARVITIPSYKTITGYEEDPVMSVVDIRSGQVRELGQGNRPEWSGSGTFLSFWRDDGYLHILQGDKRVGHIEVSHPDVRWVGDVLYYWYAEEIRTWDRGVTRTESRVANDLVPRYPRDNAFFSADGERFTITRYATDGTTERYIGVTATGETATLEDSDVTYTEWSPRGQTLLMRSQDQIALRERDGTVKSALLASLPGPVHGWSSDGRLLLGTLTPNTPTAKTFDRFAVWDGADVGSFATLPNVFGARTFSPDGRYFTGVSRTDLHGTQLELYRCGTGLPVEPARADTTSRSRAQFVETDGQRFVRPVAGMVVQFVQGRHTGVDVSAPFGSLIFAADDGVVNAVGWVPVGGRRVCVMHAEGLESCAYHTSLSLVAVGDAVVRGQTIGLVGMTGQTGGPHVHWEVRQNGRIVDPLAQ